MNAAAASGRSGLVHRSKLSRNRELTEAKTTPALTSPGLATRALSVTAPPIERPSIATSVRVDGLLALSDCTALIASRV